MIEDEGKRGSKILCLPEFSTHGFCRDKETTRMGMISGVGTRCTTMKRLQWLFLKRNTAWWSHRSQFMKRTGGYCFTTLPAWWTHDGTFLSKYRREVTFLIHQVSTGKSGLLQPQWNRRRGDMFQIQNAQKWEVYDFVDVSAFSGRRKNTRSERRWR